jgi:hypothetical protein
MREGANTGSITVKHDGLSRRLNSESYSGYQTQLVVASSLSHPKQPATYQTHAGP